MDKKKEHVLPVTEWKWRGGASSQLY